MDGRRAGTPLCGYGALKYFGMPFVIRGDLDWFFKTLKLNNYNSNEPCCLCTCNTTTKPWKDLRRAAVWLDHIWTTDSWKRAYPTPDCLLFKLDFISILCINPDWMHTMHIGVLTYAWASILWLLAYEIMEGTPVENMSAIMVGLRRFWNDNPTPGHYQGITLKMFSQANDPEGKQPQLKGTAGEIKHLSKALLHVFKAYKVRGHATYGQIALLMKKWIRMDDILDAHPPHIFPRLPMDEANEFELLGFDSCALLTSIATFYMVDEPKPLFNLIIKTHMLIHCAVQARYLNPRLAICYGGEDYMKHMKRMVAMSVRGTNAAQISKKLVDKDRAASHIEMSS